MSKLLEAIKAFQEDMPSLPRTATNPHFNSKYVPLDTLMEVVTPKLAEHGLVWMTMPVFHDGCPALQYTLTTAGSGVELGSAVSGTMPLMPAKNDPQALGSAITYARRYALMSVLGLVGEDDDDGNAATASRPADPTIPLDRARSILAQAEAAGHAEGTTPSATLKAKLVDVGVKSGKIGSLSVDQAEAVESWLKDERNGRS